MVKQEKLTMPQKCEVFAEVTNKPDSPYIDRDGKIISEKRAYTGFLGTFNVGFFCATHT